MKTHVLTLSKTFLKGHPNAGEPTYFKESFLDGTKKHTIRDNYDYWSRIIDEVRAGKAVLSIRQWSGKPYASKQDPELACLDATSGIGYQPIFMTDQGWCLEATIGNDYVYQMQRVWDNDGLERMDFWNWFFPRNGKTDIFKGIVIHFTKFRY